MCDRRRCELCEKDAMDGERLCETCHALEDVSSGEVQVLETGIDAERDRLSDREPHDVTDEELMIIAMMELQLVEARKKVL